MRPEDAVAEALTQLIESLRLVGTVSGTSGTRVLVNVRGTVLTLPRLASYSPTVGDVVHIQGPAPWLVLGKTA
ncbi:hypothetical protein [Lentzea kentuckyensis]|jgi:hypothetical protein|uniref:hypothetical protein n=1 Tax=Lentzea kentuckyensis TaxID=360086 RepID=UPI000A3A145F|nr:hypothetical protein [Lentzea kentuckyensis]